MSLIFGIYSGPIYYPTMPKTPHLTSESAACCWMPLFALRSELARRPELASHPVALFQPLFRVPHSAFRVSGGLGPREIRFLGGRDPRKTRSCGHSAGGRGGEVSRFPAARRAPARPRHTSPAAAARRQDAGRARRA